MVLGLGFTGLGFQDQRFCMVGLSTDTSGINASHPVRPFPLKKDAANMGALIARRGV